jgi:transcriptional regulator with XRE-family HTH domain
MVRLNLTLASVADATGLDERTIRSVLRGVTRPQTKTLHKIAAGLGVDADELFADPERPAAAFDRATNPAVAEVVARHPKLFAHWTAAELDELYSRVAVGGELTEAGAVAAAQAMNRRRELLKQASVILESAEGELLREFVTLLYRRVALSPPPAS